MNNKVNIYIVIGCVLLLTIGAMRGFGKTFKSATKGLIGVVFSVFVCVCFGGVIRNWPFVERFINGVNVWVSSRASFLSRVPVGLIVYYILLFVALQIIRSALVKTVKNMFDGEEKGKGTKALNKVLGAAFTLAVVAFVGLLFFSVTKGYFSETGFVNKMVGSISGSWLEAIYNNNPIKL